MSMMGVGMIIEVVTNLHNCVLVLSDSRGVPRKSNISYINSVYLRSVEKREEKRVCVRDRQIDR